MENSFFIIHILCCCVTLMGLLNIENLFKWASTRITNITFIKCLCCCQFLPTNSGELSTSIYNWHDSLWNCFSVFLCFLYIHENFIILFFLLPEKIIIIIKKTRDKRPHSPKHSSSSASAHAKVSFILYDEVVKQNETRRLLVLGMNFLRHVFDSISILTSPSLHHSFTFNSIWLNNRRYLWDVTKCDDWRLDRVTEWLLYVYTSSWMNNEWNKK